MNQFHYRGRRYFHLGCECRKTLPDFDIAPGAFYPSCADKKVIGEILVNKLHRFRLECIQTRQRWGETPPRYAARKVRQPKDPHVSTFVLAPEPVAVSTIEAVVREARSGLLATRKTLSPWLFYDEAGSHLFEKITELPEYYLTRTERSIFTAHADQIIALAARTSTSEPDPILTLIELGAGTATKTGILLAAAV